MGKALDYLQELREIRDVAMATVNDEGLPEVRIIDVMIVENGKLYFCTARGKDFYAQLRAHPYVAMTGLNKNWQMIRFKGKVHHLKDPGIIDRIFADNPSMNGVYPGASRYILDPFMIDMGEIAFFDLSDHPIKRAVCHLPDEEEVAKGFVISDDCIGCGICAGNCPQSCIEEGMPYVIIQTHCLHCGLCFENCPMQAIRRL